MEKQQLIEKIMALDDNLVVEACKNFKVGLASELRKRSGGQERLTDDAAIASLRALELEGAAGSVRDAVIGDADPAAAVQLGRLVLVAAVENEQLRPYVEGALEGAQVGVRADPVTILSIGVAIFLVGRLMPSISIKRSEQGTEVAVTPLAKPLEGLSDLVKAIPWFRQGG
jgi:hypothetical protein